MSNEMLNHSSYFLEENVTIADLYTSTLDIAQVVAHPLICSSCTVVGQHDEYKGI